jgi:hypothetical protein
MTGYSTVYSTGKGLDHVDSSTVQYSTTTIVVPFSTGFKLNHVSSVQYRGYYRSGIYVNYVMSTGTVH